MAHERITVVVVVELMVMRWHSGGFIANAAQATGNPSAAEPAGLTRLEQLTRQDEPVAGKTGCIPHPTPFAAAGVHLE
jgi:hypothetical protein